ncbi:MAG: MaoC/PaaZ C-terminal domain-containing protein [Deltaproteobacteria bacterium]
MHTMRQTFEQLNVGDEVVRLVKLAITKVQLVRYAGASGDFNPLHTDDSVAQAAGFNGVVAHGMLLLAFMTEAVTSWIPRRWFKQIKTRFKSVSGSGDILTITGVVKEKHIENDSGIVTCEIQIADESNDVKASGTFQAAFPLGKE